MSECLLKELCRCVALSALSCHSRRNTSGPGGSTREGPGASARWLCPDDPERGVNKRGGLLLSATQRLLLSDLFLAVTTDISQTSLRTRTHAHTHARTHAHTHTHTHTHIRGDTHLYDPLTPTPPCSHSCSVTVLCR